MHLAWKGDAPWELVRWTLCERFGWTLEYVDGLSMADLHQFIQIEDGRAKARPAPDPAKGKGKRR